MTKTISATEMRDRMLKTLHNNSSIGTTAWAELPLISIKFKRCDNNHGWRTDVDPRLYFTMYEWCHLNFSRSDWDSGLYYVWLKDEQMVTWFLLRWS